MSATNTTTTTTTTAATMNWVKEKTDAGAMWSAAGQRGVYIIDMPKSQTRFTLDCNGLPVGKVDSAAKLKARAEEYDAAFMAPEAAEVTPVAAEPVAAPVTTPEPGVWVETNDLTPPACEVAVRVIEHNGLGDAGVSAWAVRGGRVEFLVCAEWGVCRVNADETLFVLNENQIEPELTAAGFPVPPAGGTRTRETWADVDAKAGIEPTANAATLPSIDDVDEAAWRASVNAEAEPVAVTATVPPAAPAAMATAAAARTTTPPAAKPAPKPAGSAPDWKALRAAVWATLAGGVVTCETTLHKDAMHAHVCAGYVGRPKPEGGSGPWTCEVTDKGTKWWYAKNGVTATSANTEPAAV